MNTVSRIGGAICAVAAMIAVAGRWTAAETTAAQSAAAVAAPEILIDSMETAKVWATVGSAAATLDAAGHKGACLKVEFDARDGKGAGLVQGPVPEAAEAWKARGQSQPNGFAFWARADGSIDLIMNLRVRKPGVTGPAGVVAVTRAEVAIAKGEWRRYEIPFAAFSRETALSKTPVGAALFGAYHPQIQFAIQKAPAGGKTRTLWIDEVSFVTLAPEQLAQLATNDTMKQKRKEGTAMNWPGLDLAGKMAAAATQAPSAPAWRAATVHGMTAPAPPGARQVCEVVQGWTLLPVGSKQSEASGAMAVSAPHHFPNNRDYTAAWYVTRLALPRRDGERLVARFEQVPLYCVLFVNGVECGRHRGCYTPFEFDVTRAAKDGENVLALYVHDASAALSGGAAYNQLSGLKPDKTKFFDGGLDGAVRIERRPEAFIADVFVKTSTRRHEMTLVCELANRGKAARQARLDFAVLEWPTGAPVALSIPSQDVSLAAETSQALKVVVPWENPRLWSPEHPNLYVLRATLGASPDGSALSDRSDGSDCRDTRFGFREFWCEGKQFMLNGVPIRLRGESHCRLAHDPLCLDSAKGVDYTREVFRVFKKEYQSNSCRVHACIAPGSIALGADEAGFLLINQSSIWSALKNYYTKGGAAFMDNTRREFAEWVRRDRNCPSVVIWDVENEQIRGGRENSEWVYQLDDFVLAHDDTRPIEHSGAGWYSPTQQIVHLHMQEHYTNIFEMWKEKVNLPLTVGEFWVGGRGETRLPSSVEFTSQPEWYEEESRIYEEGMLEMRNYGISGVMPFTIARTVFASLTARSQPLEFKGDGSIGYGIRSRTICQRIQHGLQPLTVFFWPRVESATAGAGLERELVVCNDSETPRDLIAEWRLDGGAPQRTALKLAPGEQRRIAVSATAPERHGQLTARLLDSGAVVSSDTLAVRPIAPAILEAPQLKRKLLVYEGGKTGALAALQGLGLTAQPSNDVPGDPKETIWLIAPGASSRALNRAARAIRGYLEQGGRILCLAQGQWPRWPPVKLEFWPAIRAVPAEYVDFKVPEDNKDLYYSRFAPIYGKGHPIFDGIAQADLRWWSPRDGRVSDDALVRPSFINLLSRGAWRVLAGGTRPELASLVEARVGEGTLLLCQAQALEQSQTPEARAVLMNMLRYLDGPAWAGGARIRLAGQAAVSKLTSLTGATSDTFTGASAERGDVLIATDGASVDELSRWAEAGGTALVLSAEVAGRLPGYAVAKADNRIYAGAYAEGHRLLWGVSSTCFTGFDHPCVDGALSQYPKGCTVLLHGLCANERDARMAGNDIGRRGLTTMDAAEGPIAVAERRGKGEWVVTTMAPWRGQTVHDAELLSTLLANAGAAIPAPEHQPGVVQVFKTVPLKFDGKLDDWTNDVEDRNVSPYRHAQPIVLSSEDAVAEAPRSGVQAVAPQSDADLSGIVYFLWDEKALYVGGAVLGGQPATVEVFIVGPNGPNGPTGPAGPAGPVQHILSIVPKDAAARLDGKPAAALRLATGMTRADHLTDARALSLTSVDRRVGNLVSAAQVPAATFEVEAPWSALGLGQAPEKMSALIRIEREDGAVLQAPVNAKTDQPATWLSLVPSP